MKEMFFFFNFYYYDMISYDKKKNKKKIFTFFNVKKLHNIKKLSYHSADTEYVNLHTERESREQRTAAEYIYTVYICTEYIQLQYIIGHTERGNIGNYTVYIY